MINFHERMLLDLTGIKPRIFWSPVRHASNYAPRPAHRGIYVINSHHLFQTITTPRKERYRLRNRTVITTESLTPDLDTSIPFEIPEEKSPFDDVEDTLLEDANKALLEQIKQLQVRSEAYNSTNMTMNLKTTYRRKVPYHWLAGFSSDSYY